MSVEKIRKILIPDIERLAKKDSSLSTKRYAHLSLINHLIWLNWIVCGVLIYHQQWGELKYHLTILSVLAFGNGALATKFFTDRKND